MLTSLKKFLYDQFKIKIEKNTSSEEMTMTFEQMVDLRGFKATKHLVETADKYQLNIFRIEKAEQAKEFKATVYFQHGLLDSSDGWISNSPRNVIPYILLNEGFDVWIGNSRGNKYCKYNIEKSAESEEFWDYSFDEMGKYDLPAVIDYIGGKTSNKKENKLIFIGHSQGCASILAGMCQNREYFESKLLMAILLSPAYTLNHIDSKIAEYLFKLEWFFKERKINEILPFNPLFQDLTNKVNFIYPTFTYTMMELFSDEETWVMCPERIKVYSCHYPSGTSLRSISHFNQIKNSKNFQSYDFGEEENLKRYGSKEVVTYDCRTIKDIPIVICAGKKDKLTHYLDLRDLRDILKESGTLLGYYEYEYMGHGSFLLSSDILWFNYVLKDIYKILKG